MFGREGGVLLGVESDIWGLLVYFTLPYLTLRISFVTATQCFQFTLFLRGVRALADVTLCV